MGKAKILIIDDEADLLELLQRTLELEGFEVVPAYNGEEGVRKFTECAPDLVICDLMMPGMNGYDVLQTIKGKRDRFVPFIMLTGIDDFDNMQQAYDFQADYYTTKPAEKWTLIKNINTLLQLAKQHTEPAEDE